jgi:uncharacterized cupin superfamily protein
MPGYADPVTNVFEPDWDQELDQAPFILRAARVGKHAGSEKLGATLFEIAPGARVSPLHIHHANEEMAIVLAGKPSVRTGKDTHELGPGDVVAFPAGHRGAHSLQNDSEEPARVLIVSTMIAPDIAEHLESGKVLAMSFAPGSDDMGPHDLALAFRREDSVEPMLDELEGGEEAVS